MKLTHLITMITAASAATSAFAQQEPKPQSLAEQIVMLEANANTADATAATWVALGNRYMQQSRDIVGHDFSKANAAFTRALTLDPKSSEALLGMAWVKNSEHDFAAGKTWAQKALAIDPKAHDAHSLLGDCDVELGNYDEAYDHYQAALDLRLDLSSYSRAALLLWITGDSTQAKLLLQKAIDLGGPYPENIAWCRAELALMHFHSGGLLAAELEAKKAVTEAPNNPRVLAIMARILAAKGDTKEAIAHYTKSVEITPSHVALAALVDLHRVNGDDAEVKKWSEKVFAYHAQHDLDHDGSHEHQDHKHEHHHKTVEASAERAMFLAEHGGDIKQATTEAETVYQTFKNIRVEETLAWCYYKAGDFKKARLMIERAMKWGTSDAGLMFRAGMIYHGSGDQVKSRDMLAKAISLNPKFHPIHAKTATETLKALSVSAPKKTDTSTQ